MNKPKINLKYKDTVFTKYFSDKNRLIEVYNAINGTNYTPDVNLSINTLRNVLYLGRYNDISFTLDNKLVVLIEHQSTINPNMPLRFLLYLARLYEIIIDDTNLFTDDLVKMETPEFYVFYNGENKKIEDESELKLSDSFKDKSKCQIELIVKVYNINKGHSENLLNNSGSLNEYAIFIAKIRENIKNGIIKEKAIENAITYCINNNIMCEFLKEYSGEVINMLTAEFDIDKYGEAMRKSGERKGIEKGIEKVVLNAIKKNMPIEDIADMTGLTVDEINKLKHKNKVRE
ncbi:MAG: hypothetical protein FWD71_04765 [Oscillospiraceae bacterium]|nr:hypothetical protein [Oscillospiraceae bacterium]